MNVPEGLLYSTYHGWIRPEGVLCRLGLTDYAQDILGEVSFVELPIVGKEVARGDLLAEVEARKATSEIYAPVSGRVVQVNDDLGVTPEFVNDDPYGDGWICLLSSDEGEKEDLMDRTEYLRFIGV